jgi:hypothetical protein
VGGNLEIFFGGITEVDSLLSFVIITSGPQTGAFDNVPFCGQVEVFDSFSGASLGFFDVTQDGGNIVLTNFIPEPGSAGLLLLGLSTLAMRRRYNTAKHAFHDSSYKTL